jgi:hypothetical protein
MEEKWMTPTTSLESTSVTPADIHLWFEPSHTLRSVIKGAWCPLKTQLFVSSPLSYPDKFITLLDGKSEEIAFINHISELSAESRAVAAEAVRRGVAPADVTDLRVIAGRGIEGRLADGRTARLGSDAWISGGAAGVPLDGDRPGSLDGRRGHRWSSNGRGRRWGGGLPGGGRLWRSGGSGRLRWRRRGGPSRPEDHQRLADLHRVALLDVQLRLRVLRARHDDQRTSGARETMRM